MFKTVTTVLLATATFGAAAKEYLKSHDVQHAIQTAPNVKVELYFEAQCPGCQDFTTGPLKRVLAKPDMAAIIDLKLVPYGNAKHNEDGTWTCQHGEGECASDLYELCTQYKLSGDINSITTGDTSFAAWPFILCMEEAEGVPSYGQSCYESNMNTTALPWSVIEACSQDKEEADLVQTAAMKNTPAHDYVPWPLVDGVVLANTNLLQKAVCDAYTGVPPASCKAVEEVTTLRCKNENN